MNNIPSVIISEPEKQYHSRSKFGEMLSSHMLAIFNKSPFKYHKTICGEIPDKDTPDYAFGRAAHKLILEGTEAFNDTYTVSDGPINERTGKPFGKDTKAYADWLDLQSGEVVTAADFDKIQAMELSVRGHRETPNLLRPGIAEGVVRAEYCGVQCQIRMDWFSPESGIVDLKTARDMEMFEYDARSYGYILNMAFYRGVLREATGHNFPVHLIAVDKTDFHICGVFAIPEAELDAAERINAAAIMRLIECRARCTWPTGFERKRLLTLNS